MKTILLGKPACDIGHGKRGISTADLWMEYYLTVRFSKSKAAGKDAIRRKNNYLTNEV
jgi:hypothetical protein